jgi:hypothetical protein
MLTNEQIAARRMDRLDRTREQMEQRLRELGPRGRKQLVARVRKAIEQAPGHEDLDIPCLAMIGLDLCLASLCEEGRRR